MPKSFVALYCFLLVFSFSAISQNDDSFIAALVPQELTENINAVLRHESKTVTVEAYNRMTVLTKRVVTVYNKYGLKSVNALEFYDDLTKIKEMEAFVYDAWGEEIRKIKSKDFIDESAVSGGTLYSDSRVKYLDYTPVKYPVTIAYYSEVDFKKTAFIPQWLPLSDYYMSIQYAEYQIINNSEIEIKAKHNNFEDYKIDVLSPTHVIAKNIKAVKPEQYSPTLMSYTPHLKTALTRFDMEGVEGINTNWNDFGKWMYDNLLTGTDQLPNSAIEEVKQLVNGVDDKMERAKLIYKYVQDKTRYVSVQIGIGGWKPILAEEVDRLGYGDCKGLTNYTRALLEIAEVPAYYTVVYGDENIKDIDNEFSATEGNHVILCLPTEDKNVFLECTSQTNPFGYIAGFTDDRDVLLVTPQGGQIVHTTSYSANESEQQTKASIVLDDSGSFSADVVIEAKGYQYGLRQGVEDQSPRDQKLYYKDYWDNINGLNIISMSQNNDKDAVVYTEKLSLTANNYASKTGKRLIIQPNMFNKVTNLPVRYNKRQLDFNIQRGYKDLDEFVIELPENIEVEAMSEGTKIETKFGTYSAQIEQLEENKLKYTRTYILNKGHYQKEEYKEFRNFLKQVIKADQSKIVLVSN